MLEVQSSCQLKEASHVERISESDGNTKRVCRRGVVSFKVREPDGWRELNAFYTVRPTERSVRRSRIRARLENDTPDALRLAYLLRKGTHLD